jgi:hypothetical protein
MSKIVMRKISWVKVIKTIIITAILIILGEVAALWLMMAIAEGKLAYWHSFGKPPNQPVRLLATIEDFDWQRRWAKVRIETISGKVFRCCNQGQTNL